MDKNTRHLLPMWGVALFFGGLTLFGVVAALARGEILIPCVVAFTSVLIAGQVWHGRRKVLLLYRDKSPERVVAYYHEKISKIRNGNALAAQACALAFSLYGEYDRARNELSNVSWDTLPPMYEGGRTSVLSVIALLQEKNYQKALDLALEARDSCHVSSTLPGIDQSRRYNDALVSACELLAGRGNDSTIACLEHALRKLPVLGRVIPAWSLAQHYSLTGQRELAAKYAELLQKRFPNCEPLRISSLNSVGT